MKQDARLDTMVSAKANLQLRECVAWLGGSRRDVLERAIDLLHSAIDGNVEIIKDGRRYTLRVEENSNGMGENVGNTDVPGNQGIAHACNA